MSKPKLTKSCRAEEEEEDEEEERYGMKERKRDKEVRGW